MHIESNKQQAVSSKQKTITKFTDLVAWQEGHKLVLQIYKLTKLFPKDEQFALTNQMRRAAVSITSNLAEGFSRQTKADKSHFYTMSHGSLTELQNHLLIARDVNYIDNTELHHTAEQSSMVHKLIFGLLKSLKDGKGVSV